MSDQHWLASFKQILPPPLAKFYLEKIKKVGNPYREYNHKYQCIFVHIPKTAGTSFGRTIFENRDPSVSHTDCFYYRVFEPELFKQYFKFTFVRNPWDRLVSNYTYFLRSDHVNASQPSKATKFLTNYQDFESFVIDLENPQMREYLFTLGHFRPQYEFICDYKLNLLVDYLGYFETLQEDFDKIVIKLNRPELELPYLNPSKKGKDYKDYYTDRTKKIVGELYKTDIDLFGYSFEGISKRLIACSR
ncbi:MAG: hypothetical protein EA365_04210 [Gloeocapsa sp. DLM2.Bin57]|nr:MAG: hypothetical protein EA365_04210 [Gloeocapsa sp. DLM2.Bin57]